MSKTREQKEIKPVAHQPTYFPRRVKPEKLPVEMDDATISAIEREIESPTNPKITTYIKKRLNGNKYGRYSKQLFGTTQGLIYGKKGLYAIYNEDGEQAEVAEGGSYGKIKLARHMRTKEWFILKTQQIAPITALVTDASNEHSILTSLKLCHEPLMLRKSSKDAALVKGDILMKYFDGVDLVDLMMQRNHPKHPIHAIPDLFWLYASIQVVSELYCNVHQYGILHCDLKLENILYHIAGTQQQAHIIDYGSAKKRNENDPAVALSAHCIEGYNAPENLSDGLYTEKSEVYALSNILDALLFNRVTSTYLKEASSRNDEHKQERRCIGKKTLFYTNANLIKLIETMRAENPDDRPTIKTVLDNLIKEMRGYQTDETMQQQLSMIVSLLKQATAAEEQRIRAANRIFTESQAALSAFNLFSPQPAKHNDVESARPGIKKDEKPKGLK